MMAEKDLSLDNVRQMRHTFANCIEDLVKGTDFNLMYKELNTTDIGKRRMSHVFILKGGQLSQQNSQQLYDGICKEKDREFICWIKEIKRSLSRTANCGRNNGKHQQILEMLQDSSQNTRQDMSPLMSCKPKYVDSLRGLESDKVKVILLGRSGSGKTRFHHCAAGHHVTELTPTVGVDINILATKHQGESIKIALWDTAGLQLYIISDDNNAIFFEGQERFDAISQSYYRGVNGALIFVDLKQFMIARKEVIKYTKKYIQDIEERSAVRHPCLLVGAKYDLVENCWSAEDKKAFMQFANSCTEGHWVITSAQTGVNIKEAVHMIIEQVMNNMPHHQGRDQGAAAYHADGSTIKLPDNPPHPHNNQKQGKKCCK